MPKISLEKKIITGCICVIIFTLLTKSYVHEITNPQWHSAALSTSSKKPVEEDIIIHFHERRPFYLGYKDEVHGVVADQIGRAFNYADIPYQWLETPAKRQLDIIKKNQDSSCAAGWFKTAEREKFAQYSMPVYQDKPFVAIVRADNDLLNETEQLERVLKERRLLLLIKSGYSYGDYIDLRLNNIKPRLITTTGDNQNMLKMIQSHRADYCFMTEEEAQDLLLFSGLQRSDFKLVYFSDIPPGNKRYIICTKMVAKDVMARLNGAIKYLVNIEDNDQ
jgi:polar amino acid transport system substrate-binding protein